jgi:GMP synthase-like glutamine amidotransferase
MGVCFGHQILCRALGSVVERSAGDVWELALTKIDLHPIGQLLFRTPDPFIYLQQMHRDQVIDAPSPDKAKVVLHQQAQVWGSTQICPVQGLYLRGRLFTCQGHPGYDPQMVREHIERRIERGVIKNIAAAKEAMKTADSDHDGLIVSAAMLRFLNAEDVDVPDSQSERDAHD